MDPMDYFTFSQLGKIYFLKVANFRLFSDLVDSFNNFNLNN